MQNSKQALPTPSNDTFQKLNLFLKRLILSYLEQSQIYSTISNLNHWGNDIAYDCAIWNVLLVDNPNQKLSYDFSDLLPDFLRQLKNVQELTKLDLHYLFTNYQFPIQAFNKIMQFKSLRSLKFGLCRLKPQHLEILSQHIFEQCNQLRLPLMSSLQFSKQIMQKFSMAFPNIKSLEFEDVNCDIGNHHSTNLQGKQSGQKYTTGSYCQKLSEYLINFGLLESLRIRLTEFSNSLSMKYIIENIQPRLSKIYISAIVLDIKEHQLVLSRLLSQNGKMKQVVIKNQGKCIPDNQCLYQVTTLQKLKVFRLTKNYEKLGAWCERNVNLIELKIKLPKVIFEQIDGSRFQLSSLVYLRVLNISGVFSQVSLQNLPALKKLRIKHIDPKNRNGLESSKISLQTYNESQMSLSSLKLIVNQDEIQITQESGQIIVTFIKLNQLSIQKASFLNCQILKNQNLIISQQDIKQNDEVKEEEQNFSGFCNLQEILLDSINYLMIQKKFCLNNNYLNGGLRNINILFQPNENYEYIQDFIPALAAFPRLYTLTVDLRYFQKESKSSGCVYVQLPQLITFNLIYAYKTDNTITITQKAKSLQNVSISYADNVQKIVILSPSIRCVKINCIKKLNQLVITEINNSYKLHLEACPVLLKNCPGVGKLVIETNWCDKFISETFTQNFYKNLTAISMRDVNKYSNSWLHSFIKTAPNLNSLNISFYKFVGLIEPEKDKIIHILHPNLQWVTLLRGEYIFEGIRVDKQCNNLKLLKFRDFQLNIFQNQGGYRFWAEKCLLKGNQM